MCHFDYLLLSAIVCRVRARLQDCNLESIAQGLVLGCIDAKFCKKICVGKHSPRSTQWTPLHRFQRSVFPKSTRSTRKPEIRFFFPDRPSRRQKSRLIFPKSTKSTPKIYEIWVVEIRSPAAYHFCSACKSEITYYTYYYCEILADAKMSSRLTP